MNKTFAQKQHKIQAETDVNLIRSKITQKLLKIKPKSDKKIMEKQQQIKNKIARMTQNFSKKRVCGLACTKDILHKLRVMNLKFFNSIYHNIRANKFIIDPVSLNYNS